MGFRFRHSFKIIPGVRLNLSGSGASVSLGPRGAHFTIGPHGTRTTVGLPGSGITWTAFREVKHSRHFGIAQADVHPGVAQFWTNGF
jgi:hypothetical protein